MASGGGAALEPADVDGGGRRRPRRHHDRRVMSSITVETVVPSAVCDADGREPMQGVPDTVRDGEQMDKGQAEGTEEPQAVASHTKLADPDGPADSLSSTAYGATGGTPPHHCASPSGTSHESTTPHTTSTEHFSGGACPPQPDLTSLRWDRDRPPAREQSAPPRAARDGTPAEEPQLEQKPFVSGNPFVEVTHGLLHFYKENSMTSLEEGVERSEMVCMLSVPATMVIHDLLNFTAPCAADIERMRIIRDNTPNQYMVLIKFRSQAAADEFYRNFNGVLYNSMEPETCHLVYVSRVDVVNESDDARLPIPGFTELPTCPVCLERMDESVDGVLTVLCNHSFHSSCLSKWGDTSCPVCRFVQTPELSEDHFCFECQAGENLWICLVCGHVGCGRYVGGHAYSHFLETGHTYTMRVGSTRVWDYVGDNFVHRLVQNNEDGKMVEVNGGRLDADRDKQLGDTEEKLEGIQLEYTYLLTSQLQSQRQYYEERISRVEKEAQLEADELKERTRAAVEQTLLLKEKLQQAANSRATTEKKVTQLSQRLTKCLKELQEERQINKSLHDNQSGWQQRVHSLEQRLTDVQQQKDKEVGELKEQLRDVMFFLEAQQQIAQAPSGVRQELAEGSIVVPESPPAAKPHGAGRKKKR